MFFQNQRFVTLLQATCIVVIIPLIVSLMICVHFSIIPSNFWQSLFPAATNAHPQLNQNFVFVTSANGVTNWDYSAPIIYTYPQGRQLWLVLKEGAYVPAGSYGSIGSFYGVDVNGVLWDTPSCRLTNGSHCLDQTNPDGTGVIPWEVVSAEKREEVLERVRYDQIIASDQSALDTIGHRLPEIADNVHPLLLTSDVFKGPQLAEPNLHPSLVLFFRLSMVLSIIFTGVGIALWHSRQSDYWQVPLVFVAIVAMIMIFIPVVVGIGWLLKSLSIVFVSFWVGLVGYYGYLVVRSAESGVSSFLKFARRYHVTFGLIVLFSLSIFPRFFSVNLTWSDAARYVTGAMFIYDHGYWPLSDIVTYTSPTSLLANYPPGPAVLLAVSSWISVMPKDQIFFPSHYTGQALYLYAFWFWLLQIVFGLSAATVVQILFSHRRWAWLLTLIVLWASIPSMHGNITAAETLLWPAFGATLVGLIIWYKTQLTVSWIGSLVIISSIFVTKQEGWLLVVALLIPFIIYVKSNQLRWSWLLIGLAVAFLPYVVLTWQKIQIGIFGNVYTNISLSHLWEQQSVYRTILNQIVEQTLVQKIGWLFIVSLLLCSTHMLYDKKMYWKNYLAIGSILMFIFLLAATYVFSTEPNVTTHINVSWSRLIIYPALTAAALWVINVGEFEKKDRKIGAY